MTVALTLPEADEFWLHAFSEGLAAAAADFELPLVGGDTTRGPLTITVQVLGALPADRALFRAGARVGDDLYVSGTLGDAAGAVAFLRGDWQPAPDAGEFLLDRFNRPRPRIALGLELLGRATAAIDVSDGLLADAGHIADASGVRLRIEPELLPISDDYELCFTLPAGESSPAGCTRVGRAEEGEGVDCGLAIDFAGGYEHF